MKEVSQGPIYCLRNFVDNLWMYKVYREQYEIQKIQKVDWNLFVTRLHLDIYRKIGFFYFYFIEARTYDRQFLSPIF